VDERQRTLLHEIDAALKQNGFRRDWERPLPHYVGELDKTGLRIPVSVEIQDTDFVKPPVIRLLRAGDSRLRPLAHVAGPEGLVCYLDTRVTVLDRYRPGETVVRCLAEAERVLRDALCGRSTQDFAGEFQGYWADLSALVDLPDGFEGVGSICWLSLSDSEYLTPLLVRPERLSTSFKHAHRAASSKNIPALTECCRIVAVDENLALNPEGRWPPADIAALSDWLTYLGRKASGSLAGVVCDGEGLRRWLAIRAPNGCAIARIDIPAKFNTPEFLRTRKAALLSHLLREGHTVLVTRYGGVPVDERYLYCRNLGGMKTLAGQVIVLIGCGAIGSFLGKALAQSGAGSNGGKLILIDNDVLSPGNLGRHLLGLRDLGRNKAEACRDGITSDLPHLDVVAEPGDALRIFGMISRCSLVIDATGEEAFSIALNHFAVTHRPNHPPVLHTWLAGNGSIAQSLLSDGDKYACFKCMKPVLDGQPRYRAIRSERDIHMEGDAACGDGLFVPFPVSRAVAAAGLALDTALDWANDKPEPRFRNRLLDPRQAFNVKDANPAPSAACPACRKTPK
jgi:molybdopterin/thiamine biosynthesis adenylyltransferase